VRVRLRPGQVAKLDEVARANETDRAGAFNLIYAQAEAGFNAELVRRINGELSAIVMLARSCCAGNTEDNRNLKTIIESVMRVSGSLVVATGKADRPVEVVTFTPPAVSKAS
jgi:hypothetical protein